MPSDFSFFRREEMTQSIKMHLPVTIRSFNRRCLTGWFKDNGKVGALRKQILCVSMDRLCFSNSLISISLLNQIKKILIKKNIFFYFNVVSSDVVEY
jgi:hypothetical protein